MPDLTTAARELLEYPRIIGAETMPDEVYVPIDFVEEMERALRSALEASGWQPIETAPKNHLPVLAYCDGFIVEAFRDVTWHWYLLSVGGPAKRMKVAPDFWMPKPPRPLPAP